MKTMTNKISMITIMTLFFSWNVFASGLNELNNETYIDDIPFDTELVVENMDMQVFDLEEESYIDDIPFNTEDVAETYNDDNLVTNLLQLDDEEYIDDIPFDTEAIAKSSSNYLKNNLTNR